jgi:hypothetical protein
MALLIQSWARRAFSLKVLKLSSTSHVKFLWSIISEVAAIQSDQSQQEGIQVHPCRYLLPLFLILH